MNQENIDELSELLEDIKSNTGPLKGMDETFQDIAERLKKLVELSEQQTEMMGLLLENMVKLNRKFDE